MDREVGAVNKSASSALHAEKQKMKEEGENKQIMSKLVYEAEQKTSYIEKEQFPRSEAEENTPKEGQTLLGQGEEVTCRKHMTSR